MIARTLAVAALVALAGADRSSHAAEASLYDVPLVFVDDSGARVELSSFRGRRVVLSMFYTRCVSKCPATLAKLGEIQKAFEARAEPVEIVLVSYDSNLDGPRRLAGYRKRERLPPQWRLLSGSLEATERLAERIGLGRYLNMGDHIFHDYRIVLLNEAGVVTKVLDKGHNKVASLFEPDVDH
jgi:protein SCO1/2